MKACADKVKIVSYVWQKGTIVGPALKIPFMGPFIDAIYPKFWKYKRQWASGELSCVSIFHKSVVQEAVSPPSTIH